ncbi:MAG: flagellar protein FlgN [Firmicutes bacterium]|nr:flagellar protein FlgN [Bacillota bacterium]
MQVIDAFVQVMREEIELISQLTHLGQEKQKHISDVELLKNITEKEQNLLGHLELVELERVRLFDVIAPEQTLSEWVQQLNEPEIAAIVEELHVNYAQLNSVNTINQMLIQESLAYIQFSINLLVDDFPATYTKPGTTNLRKSIFDRKV